MSKQAIEDGCYRILVVGNFILRRGIASIVGSLTARMSIVEAQSFRDGKARLRCEEFFAAFFHVDGEEQNGPLDFQVLRANHPQLILTVLSRSDSPGAILRYLAAGVNGYILHPARRIRLQHQPAGARSASD